MRDSPSHHENLNLKKCEKKVVWEIRGEKASMKGKSNPLAFLYLIENSRELVFALFF